MIRLSSIDGRYYYLKDTVTKQILGRCQIIYAINGEKGAFNEIWSVHINPEFRQKGYGTIMLQRIIKKYKRETEPLVLYVYKNNNIAIHLYEKLGFKITGEYNSNVWTM